MADALPPLDAETREQLMEHIHQWAADEPDDNWYERNRGDLVDNIIALLAPVIRRQVEGSDSYDRLAREIVDWQHATFGHATPASCAAHLLDEAQELVKAPTDPEEMADVFLLIVGVADRAGIDLRGAVRGKLEKNKRRAWGPVQPNGVVYHVDDESAPVGRDHRIYIAGPMTGLPDSNYPAFHAAAAAWRAQGWTVLNPAEAFDGDQTRTYAEYMREDIRALLTVQAIAFLPGWERSRGACFERRMGEMLGLAFYDAVTFEPLQNVAASVGASA